MPITAQTSEVEVALGKGDHVVCFYESESELFETVGRYLADAARTRAVAIVIATDAHQRAFEEQLDAAGIDPIKARWNGRLVSRDAAATLARSLPDGRIDAGAFDRVIGGIIREASEAWRPVRVYCEMEALLWDAGDVLEAIELEQLSNQLGEQLPFSRLCAYRSASVAGHEHAAALQDICHLHSSVLPVQNGDTHDPPGTGSVIAQVSGTFPASSDAPRPARQFVAKVLQEWGYGDLVRDARIVTSELANNAVLHARSPFSVLVRPEQSGVRISVHDASPVAPRLLHLEPMAPSGRGLHLVSALADDWGFESTALQGKTVWARLQAGNSSWAKLQA